MTTKTAEAQARQAADHQASNAPAGPVRVGPLTVRAEAAEAQDFCRQTGAPASSPRLPFTFPVRWLAHAAIRAAAASLVAGDAWVPIHESQSFDYSRSLMVDTDYQMWVEIRRESEPARLVLQAEIGASDIFLRTEMILRIIPAPVEPPA